MPPRSTRIAGWRTLSNSVSIVSSPPPSTHTSLLYRFKIASASSTLAGWKSSKAGIMPRIEAMADDLLLDMGLERHVLSTSRRLRAKTG